MHTLHPARCDVGILACHTGQRKQPNDNIQHPIGQIQMAMTTISTNVLQERCDRVLKRHPKCSQHADDVLVVGKAEVPHDKCIITLLETARANKITYNCDKFIVKSKDVKFFGGNHSPEEYKVDPKKVQAITEMKPSQNLQIFRATCN